MSIWFNQIYMVIHWQTVSFVSQLISVARHVRCLKLGLKSGWLYTRDDSNFDWKPGWLYVSRISYFRAIVILHRKWRNFLWIPFYIHIIGYQECSIHEKSYCILAYVTAGIFPNKSAQSTVGSIYIVIYRTDCFFCITTLQFWSGHAKLGLKIY